LDQVLRNRVENILLTRLRDPKTEFDQRADCVFIGLVLEEYGHDFAVVAISPILEAMAKTTDPDALWRLAQAVAALGPRLGPAEAAAAAAAAARKVPEARAKTTDPLALGGPAGAVAGLAPRLRPARARPAPATSPRAL